jgi:hypothetical protein
MSEKKHVIKNKNKQFLKMVTSIRIRIYHAATIFNSSITSSTDAEQLQTNKMQDRSAQVYN